MMVEGGFEMDPDILWSLFMDTGAPELYLLYQKAAQGAQYVLENRGPDPTGDRI